MTISAMISSGLMVRTMDKTDKYDILIGIILDNAWINPMNDALIFNDAKTSQDIRTFLMAFEPDLYEKRYNELRR